MTDRKTIPSICVQCGLTFNLRLDQAKAGGGKYCGHSCSLKHRYANNSALKQKPIYKTKRNESENISHSMLLELLDYNKLTGIFKRKTTTYLRAKAKQGDIAGYSNGSGYLSVTVANKSYKAHRLAWFYITGEWPKGVIDHINGDKSDNRFENIRDVTQQINCQNKRIIGKTNTSGFMGVSLLNSKTAKEKKWRAAIKVFGKTKYLGLFDDPELAHEAYLSAKRLMHEGCTV